MTLIGLGDNKAKEVHMKETSNSCEGTSLGNLSSDIREPRKDIPVKNTASSSPTEVFIEAGSSFNNSESAKRNHLSAVSHMPLTSEGWKQVSTFNKKTDGLQKSLYGRDSSENANDQVAWMSRSSSLSNFGNPQKLGMSTLMATGMDGDVHNATKSVVQAQHESSQGIVCHLIFV